MTNRLLFPGSHINKRIWAIIGCLFGSLLLVWLLYIISVRVNHRPNGFIRLFPPNVLAPGKFRDVDYNSYYIAGATGQRIYLGNHTAPSYLLATDYALSDTQHIRLHIGDRATNITSARVNIDSPHIYMTNGRASDIFYGAFPSYNLYQLPNKTVFNGSMPLSPASFALRTYDGRRHQNILLKQMLNAPPAQPAANILEKQVDGFFCTDGILNYDPITARLVYVYYYRNQFICLDTNLNVLYKARTIDTFSHARIKVAGIASERKITMSTPDHTVNRLSSVDGKWLFVNSKLPANNENTKVFDKCSVIDVYALKDGRYAFSFYLPDYYANKISGFRVVNKTVIAIYGHYLATYRLNFENIKS